jgi:hypothetical protein
MGDMRLRLVSPFSLKFRQLSLNSFHPPFTFVQLLIVVQLVGVDFYMTFASLPLQYAKGKGFYLSRPCASILTCLTSRLCILEQQYLYAHPS